MKIVIISIAFAITLSSMSCSPKTTITGPDDFSALPSKIKAAINSDSLGIIRNNYLLLSHKEQQILWDAKLNIILINDADKLSLEQRNIVQQIKTFLARHSMEKMFKNPTIGETFLQSNLFYFTKHFSSTQLYFLLECPYFTDKFSIFKINEYSERLVPESRRPTEGGKLPYCDCFWSVSCGFLGLYDQCNSGKCTKTTGCGMFGTSNCVGLCGGGK